MLSYFRFNGSKKYLISHFRCLKKSCTNCLRQTSLGRTFTLQLFSPFLCPSVLYFHVTLLTTFARVPTSCHSLVDIWLLCVTLRNVGKHESHQRWNNLLYEGVHLLGSLTTILCIIWGIEVSWCELPYQRFSVYCKEVHVLRWEIFSEWKTFL